MQGHFKQLKQIGNLGGGRIPDFWKRPAFTKSQKYHVQKLYGELIIGALEDLHAFHVTKDWEAKQLTMEHLPSAWKIINKYFPTETPQILMEEGSTVNLTQILSSIATSSDYLTQSHTSESCEKLVEIQGSTPTSSKSLSEIAESLQRMENPGAVEKTSM